MLDILKSELEYDFVSRKMKEAKNSGKYVKLCNGDPEVHIKYSPGVADFGFDCKFHLTIKVRESSLRTASYLRICSSNWVIVPVDIPSDVVNILKKADDELKVISSDEMKRKWI